MLLFKQMKKIGKWAIWQLMSVVILLQTCIYSALKLPRNLKYSTKHVYIA